MSAPGQLNDNEIYLGSFLLERLAQLGVNKLFGVPGDVSLFPLKPPWWPD